MPDFRPSMPFSEGIKRTIAWFDADPARRVAEPEANDLLERIIAAYESIWP